MAGDVVGAKVLGLDEAVVLVQGPPARRVLPLVGGQIKPVWVCGLDPAAAVDADARHVAVRRRELDQGQGEDRRKRERGVHGSGACVGAFLLDKDRGNEGGAR